MSGYFSVNGSGRPVKISKVDKKKFDENWDRIFSKKEDSEDQDEKKEPEHSPEQES